jgi:hypothetical protein
MEIPVKILAIAAVLGGLAVSAQTFQTNLTYVCGGERMIIESCNMRDLSDNSSCLVQHPDRPLHNGFPAYTNETRGTLKKLVPTCQQPSADAVAREQARQKKQQDQQDAAFKKANAPDPSAVMPAPSAAMPRPSGASGPPAADGTMIRCLESGRSQAQCGAKGSANPFMAIVNALLPSDSEEKKPTGLYALGSFKDPSGVRMDFSESSIQLASCGTLVSLSLRFTVSMKGNQAVLTVGNSPQPFLVAFRPDGKLAGPGPVDVEGLIVTGSTQEWYIPVPTATNLSPHGYYRTIDTYRLKTQRCNVGVMTPTGPVALSDGNLLDIFNSSKQKTVAPGLHVEGEYFGVGGFSIRFYPDAAVLHCGESADTQSYSVENTGSQTLLRIQNGPTPLVLNFRQDGRLAGSGQVAVNGRRLIGKSANGSPMFAPRPATCEAGVLSPARMPISAAPADGSATAVLTASVGPATASGLFVPLAGANLNLLRKNLENTLKEIGFRGAPGDSAVRRFLNCGDDPDCRKAGEAVRAILVSAADSGKDGKAAFPAVPPGTYYLMGAGGNLMWWDVQVDLKAGANSVRLDQRNANVEVK